MTASLPESPDRRPRASRLSSWLGLLALVAAACTSGPAPAALPTGRVRLAPADEPGERMQLVLTVVDEARGFPLAGVTVELVQTDAAGRYGPDPGVWSPRLTASAQTDARGQLRIDTIRPGAYRDDQGAWVPVHVHFTATAAGYRPFAAETPLEDDPRFDAQARSAATADGLPVARRASPLEGVPVFEARIPLQRNP